MGWLMTFLTGLALGIPAAIVVPGRQNFGFIVTILIGVYVAIVAKHR